MKPFDLLILDMTTPRPYEAQTLELEGIGGTEASVIRVAEAIASIGARVGVMQHCLDKVLSGPHAFYLPMSLLNEVKTSHYIALRGTHYLEHFKKARTFSWHEDIPDERFSAMRNDFMKYDTTVIAASDWHKGRCQELVCNPNEIHNPYVTRIYNPVPDTLYVPKNVDIKYDRNKLVWPASPHKGLKAAVELVNRLVDVSGNKDFRLHVFNPGYFRDEFNTSPYVVDHGPVKCADLWQHMSEALCVFYPTHFEETFGCIAAEANAVHTPVLTHELAALAETVSSRRQFVPKNDPKAIIDTVIKWWGGDRPKVWGQDKFRLSNVAMEWVKLLAGKVY